MSSLQDRWIKGERWNEFAQVLALPVVQDALAIIEEQAKPNAPANAHRIHGLAAPEAAFTLVGTLNIQAGMQAAVDRFRALAKTYTAPTGPAVQEPYGHVNEKYFEGQKE